MGNLGPNGVRPAFNLNLGSVLFTSAASGGKACENEGTVNALTAVNTYTGTEWKVTLKDDTRSEFAVDADKVLFNEETGVVTVPYSGAATGTNEYISAIITDKPVTDASAKIKYYGRIAPASSAKGASVTINTAGKMQDGDTLYLFNEQYNGDKKTDCASGLIEIKRAPAVVTTKPTAAATTKPTANSLTYNAKPQKLVTEGEATGGTMQYFVSDSASAAPTSGWSDDIPEQTNTGMYYVWYKAKGDSNHADSEPDYVTAEIGKKKLTITATDQTYVYNGQTQGEGDTAYRDPAQIAEKVTVTGLEGSDALTSIVIDGQGSEIGEYKLEVSGAAIGKATGNYDIGYVNGKIIITPIPLNVTVKGSGTNKVYNGKEQTIKGTVTATSSDAGFDASKFKYTGSTVAKGTGAGVYTVPLTKDKCSYSDKYYTVKWTMDTPVKLTIKPAKLSITVKGSGGKKTYNGKQQTYKGTVTAVSKNTAFDASKFSYTGSVVAKGTNVGDYTTPLVKKGCSYKDNNYTVDWTVRTPVKLTIKPAKLSITVKGSGGKKTYNGKQQTCEGTVTAVSRDAVFNVSKFSYTGSTVAKGTNVGDYTTPLNKSNCSYKDKNCVVSWTIGAPVKLTIKPARLNITVKGSSVKKTYNGRKQTCKGTVTATSGNTAFDASKFSYSGSTIAEGKEVGDYTTPLLKKKCAYQDRNYVVSWTIGNPIKLSIMPARNDDAVSGTLLVGMTAKGKNGLRFHWTKVTGADGYDVFLARCNHTKSAKDNWTVRTLKGNKTFSWTKTGLKKHTSYKVRVKAWVMKDGKKKYVSASPTAHGYTGGYRDKYTNPKSVSVNKTKVSLKVRKTAIIKARVTKLKKNLKDMPASHAPKLRYITSDSKVATVNGSGKITAKSKGTCKIYVYAVNGAYKTVTVTVR